VRALLIVITVLWVATPVPAIARPRPKLAVAPLDGDPGNKVAAAIVEALSGKDFTVVGPRETGREITRLDLPAELDAKATRKLSQKLGVVAVIDGKVGKAGGKKSLHLEVHRRGKPDAGFTVAFSSVASAKFRKAIHAQIDKKLEGAGEDPAGDDEDAPRSVAQADDGERKHKPADDDASAARPSRKLSDDDAPRRKPAEDDDAPRRKPAAADKAADKAADQAADKAADDDTARRPKKPAGDDRKRRVAAAAAADDDGGGAVRKRKGRRRSDDDATPPRVAARVAAGAAVAQRQLSYDTRSGFTQIPPKVLTTAGSGRVDGEIYPFLLADPSSGLAALGLAAAYDKTFGLKIKIPNQTVSAPISQSHFAIGARYRIDLGDTASVALGLDYAARQYVADRSGLMAAVLDAPDVDYAAISPGAALRVAVTGSVTAFAGADALLILAAGAIQKSASYGPATVYGLEGTGGVDIAITRQIGVRIALEYSQIMFSFSPKGPTLANNRDNNPATQDVMGATDRSIGVAATLGLVY
jgi:hypothetical protein